jgi:hypothetical protein
MEKAKLNKKKHFDCKNCENIEKVKFKNSVQFCFGLIKKRFYKVDCYRFCIIKKDNRNANDVMIEELYSLLMGLTSILFHKKLKDINKRKK